MITPDNKDLMLTFSSVEWIFKYIPAGEFIMGSDNGLPIETPAHKVFIEQPFLISQYPVTQALWQYVMGHNPSHFYQSDSNVVNSNVVNSKLANSNVVNSKLANSNVVNSNVVNSNAVNSNVVNSNAVNSNVVNSNLVNSNLVNSNLVNGNLVNSNPADNKPVENVSWLECILFCEKFKDIFGLKVRLPSESEWEYACRANSQDEYFFGNSERSLRDYAWYDMNSQDETRPVGLKLPNAWGLFDMAGNVWEWCADDWRDDYNHGSLTSAAVSLSTPSLAMKKVLRGGACNLDSYRCRSSYRSCEQADYREKTFGFRIVLDIDMA